MKMTESKFKTNCVYLGSKYDKYNEFVYERGKQYFNETPSDDKVEEYTKRWNDYLVNGKRSDYYTIEMQDIFNTSHSLEEFLMIQW